MERTIKVTGKGKISVKPDRIRLRISVEDMNADYEAALKASAEMTETLKDLFESLGFDRKDLKTLNFHVDTVYESYQASDQSWKRRFEGYKFIHRMKLEFDADNALLGKVLYAVANCSAKPEFSIEYTVSDPEKAKNELLGKAVADSKEKAAVLSKAAGVSLGEIITIDYSWGEIDLVTRPMNKVMLEARCMAAEPCDAGSYEIDIEAEDIEVTDTVTVIWSIS